MGFFERYLTLWVALCIVAGIALGHLLPDVFQSIGRMEIAQVNLPVAVLIWLMIIPMLPTRCRALRCRAVGADRREQLFRAGGGWRECGRYFDVAG
jgi:ACR3 family arsenite efflux pump ArsB